MSAVITFDNRSMFVKKLLTWITLGIYKILCNMRITAMKPNSISLDFSIKTNNPCTEAPQTQEPTTPESTKPSPEWTQPLEGEPTDDMEATEQGRDKEDEREVEGSTKKDGEG